jgi:hypothetical protein
MKDRKKIIGHLQRNHENYISWLATDNDTVSQHLKKIKKEFNDLLRKETSSENSVKQIIKLTKQINRVYEFIKSKGLTNYDFALETELINKYAIGYLSQRYNSKYNGKFKFNGENLLNLYLELVIKFTILKSENERNIRPDFLKNSLTDRNLELDIFYKDFKLAFEFQGEHHYSNEKQKEKDKVKLEKSIKKGVLLIPINACQLNSSEIISLTINNVKDFYDLNNALLNIDNQNIQKQKSGNITAFQKLAQRMHLSKIIFHDSFLWLDKLSNNYMNKAKRITPDAYTINYPAPTLLKTEILDIETIYRNIKYLNKKNGA